MEGGGARGVLGAQFLALLEGEIEKSTSGKTIPEFFDFFAGSSIGGIHALFFTKPATEENGILSNSAAKLLELYSDESLKKIFPEKGWLATLTGAPVMAGPEYGDAKKLFLEGVFKNHTLADATKDVLIPAYEYVESKAVYFSNSSSEYLETRLSDIADATSAAPAYFKLTVIEREIKAKKKKNYFMDGSFLSNNMCLNALFEAKHNPNIAKLHDRVKILSIGAAIRPPEIEEDEKEDSREWTTKSWLDTGRLIERMMLTPALNSVRNCEKLLGDNFMHIPFEKAPFSKIDDVDKAIITNLKEIARDEFKEKKDAVMQFLNLP